MEVDNYITENYTKIMNLCLKYCKDKNNADDLFQDFYLHLREKHPCNLKKQTGYFFGFLMKCRIADNPEKQYLSTDIEITDYQHPITNTNYEHIDYLQRLRKRLPEAYKIWFDAIYLEDNVTEMEIAQRLGKTRYEARQIKIRLHQLMGIKRKNSKLAQ
jgi:DNA-directed RNA polymerase specialized sigma24 family protein